MNDENNYRISGYISIVWDLVIDQANAKVELAACLIVEDNTKNLCKVTFQTKSPQQVPQMLRQE